NSSSPYIYTLSLHDALPICNLGLTSRQKFLAQVVIGIIFYLVLIFNGFNNQLNLPIIGNLPLGYLYGFFAVFWLVGFSNATNLTDGIDGLMASTGTIAYAAYAYIAYMQEQWGVLVFALSVIGGLRSEERRVGIE